MNSLAVPFKTLLLLLLCACGLCTACAATSRCTNLVGCVSNLVHARAYCVEYYVMLHITCPLQSQRPDVTTAGYTISPIIAACGDWALIQAFPSWALHMFYLIICNLALFPFVTLCLLKLVGN